MPSESEDGGIPQEWEFEPGDVVQERHPMHSPIDGSQRNPKEYRIKRCLREEPSGKRFYHVIKQEGGTHLYSNGVLEGIYDKIALEESEHFPLDVGGYDG